MTIAELIKDFFDSSRERIKSPITGSFIIAFLLWNWRPILLLLFSDEDMKAKIAIIDVKHCTWDAIVMPIVFSVLYVATINYIMWGFDTINNRAHLERTKNKYYRKARDLSDYRVVLIQQRKNEEERNATRDTQILNDQIEGLNKQIDTLKSQHEIERNNLYEIIEKRNKEREHISDAISYPDHRDMHNFSIILDLTPSERLQFYEFSRKQFDEGFYYISNSYNAGRWIKLGLISEKNDNGKFIITEKGKQVYKFILDNLELISR